SEKEIDDLEKQDIKAVRDAQRRSWDTYRAPIDADVKTVITFLERLGSDDLRTELQRNQAPFRRDAMRALTQAIVQARENVPQDIVDWRREQQRAKDKSYEDELYSESALKIPEVKASYADDAPEKNGFEIINACFDAAFKRMPNLIALGEDVGKLGDVNQGCLGLQEKYGIYRVSDTGIRECTIVGQAIGMALRGLRAIAEIQYLDYILYALQILSDDLAMTRWRTRGGQKCPAIIRTRGHR